MLTFEAFKGINNAQPVERLTNGDLLVAENVDIGLTGEVARRSGYSEASDLCHKNLHQGDDFMLATVASALTAIHPNGDRVVIHPALGTDRVRYCNLPDGRTTFSNGQINGITDGLALADWSLPVPDGMGMLDATVLGALNPGSYRYFLTYVRLVDLMEGPAIDSDPVALPQGGFRLDGLPARDGYSIYVYLTGQDGEGAYFAGATTTRSITITGPNINNVLPCPTIGTQPMPVGTFTAFWRGRTLVAVGNALWASVPWVPGLCVWRDFKQFSSAITMIVPVEGGIWVGTEDELAWLAGTQWEQLAYSQALAGRVVPGSGVAAPGDQVQIGQGVGSNTCMLCIAAGGIVAGTASGTLAQLTDTRYSTDVEEVAATWRKGPGGVPQYIAIPQ